MKGPTIHHFCPSFPMPLTILQKAVSNWTCACNDSQASYTHLHPLTPTWEPQTHSSLPITTPML